MSALVSMQTHAHRLSVNSHSVYAFGMILTVNMDYCPTQH